MPLRTIGVKGKWNRKSNNRAVRYDMSVANMADRTSGIKTGRKAYIITRNIIHWSLRE